MLGSRDGEHQLWAVPVGKVRSDFVVRVYCSPLVGLYRASLSIWETNAARRDQAFIYLFQSNFLSWAQFIVHAPMLMNYSICPESVVAIS